MSSRFKLAALAGVAALTCCMPASASAAAGWMVGGTQLSGTAKIKTTDPSSFSEVSFPGIAVSCDASSIEVENGTIGSPASLELSSVTFKDCSTTPTTCQLVGTTLKTGSLLGEEITLEGALAVRGRLQAKSTFMVMEFEGELCALAGTKIALKGGVDFLEPEAQDERTSQAISWFALAHQLTVGSNEVQFGYRGALLLESGKPWSFL
jgi:hypothetical protein